MCRNYIHTFNRTYRRAGMVRHPGEYPWSCYRCNAHAGSSPLITPHDCWLELGEDDIQRASAYRELVNERMRQADLDHIRESLDKALPTGNKRFTQETEHAPSIRLSNCKRGRPGKIQE
jgi:putative transposase